MTKTQAAKIRVDSLVEEYIAFKKNGKLNKLPQIAAEIKVAEARLNALLGL